MDKKCYIDIFAGCGGLSLGLHNAGWTGLFAIEKNKDAFSTLHHNLVNKEKHFNWPSWLPMINHDINEILANYREQLACLNGKVSLVVGGPPCQGFSMAGKRDSNDIRNTLSDSYIEFIKIVKPRMLFFENVHGFTVGFKNKNAKKKPYSEYVKKKLQELGYNVKYDIIDISEYGVPQKRKRFIMVGCLEMDPDIFFQRLASNKASFQKQKHLSVPVSIQDAIGDLLNSHGVVDSPDTRNFKAGLYGKPKSDYQKLMRANLSTKENIPVDSHRFTKHTDDIVELYKKMLVICPRSKRISPEDGYVEGFHKRGVTVLDANALSPTVTSHPDDFLHYSEPRILTVRESARIQSFPDWYEFKGKYTTGGKLRKVDVPRYTQVGNAVPPLFAEQVGLVFKEILPDE